MSIAKIIAALVERGEEDLANELIEAGGSRLMPYIVRVIKTFDGRKAMMTSMEYRIKDAGKPSDKNLKKWVEHFNKALGKGGVNSRIGVGATILEAEILDQQNGNKVVAHYKNPKPPMFLAADSEIDAELDEAVAAKLNKAKVIDMLFDVLEACNAADSDQNTDLPSHAASQRSTFGYVAEAIQSLGAKSQYNNWVKTNER